MENTEEKMEQSMEAKEDNPVTMHQVEALRNCVIKKIEHFGVKGRKNKTGATIVQIIIILFSVATPIFIGWKVNAVEVEVIRTLTNFALICSAVTAGSNMLYNFFDYKDLWVQYKVSISELELIISELDYLESAGIDNTKQPQIDLLFKKYVDICSDINRSYREIRLTKDPSDIK